MTWSKDLPQGNEARKCKYDIVRYTRGKVLDLGSGPWKPFPHFISIDTRDEWTDLPWNPDIIMDATRLSIFASNSLDAAFSSHLLQIVDDPFKVLKEWWRVIKPGGYLILYLPHKELYPNVGHEDAHKLHRHDFMPADIVDMMRKMNGWDLVVNEDRDHGDEYSFLQVYRKLNFKDHKYTYMIAHPQKKCIVLRYGGIGDSIQASSILPLLKGEGYHITFLTQPDGYEILKSDPFIDEFFIKERNQVPMEELGAFWSALARHYDKFVNLTETVEVALLPVPQMTSHKWPKEVRHMRFNVNYLEFTHAVAGVPYDPLPMFYPTEKEHKWAVRWKEKKGGNIIMWCVGSSIHKTWPYLDQMIARIMLEFPNWKVVMVGEELDRILEFGWENEPRVIKKAGKWSVRQTLTMARIADLVIGPETGILNTVSHTNIAKIIHLSHSSSENLTRDWINCITLTPQSCSCYPCHQLNASFNECPRHHTGVAKCQGQIFPETMWNAIKQQIHEPYRKAS
jgi:ADP-heptose:LPS heptosyltransferase/predicted SAM-dependent methyltransferase